MDQQDGERQRLRDENDELRRQLADRDRQIGELTARVRELQDLVETLQRQGQRQAAPFRRDEQRKKPAGQRKRPGRGKGHVGCYRLPPEREPDETVRQPLEGCPGCGRDLTRVRDLEQFIEELPPIEPRLIRLITQVGDCPRCGAVHSTHALKTSVAAGAAKTQLGPRAVGLVATLNQHLGLPTRKTCRVLNELCGLRLSAGGVVHAMRRAAKRAEPALSQLRDELRDSPAVHADETSWWVGGPGYWLWTYCTPTLALYLVRPSRASAVVAETLGEAFAGVLVSDCLSSYDPPTCRKHKCIHHHLQAIRDAQARLSDGDDASWLAAVQRLFQNVCLLTRVRDDMTDATYSQARTSTATHLADLLSRAPPNEPSTKVLNRLVKQRDHLLTCLFEPGVASTNNLAERMLRPAVIARKVSCGNKTLRGAHTFEVLASLAQTCHLRAQPFAAFLADHLRLPAVAR